MKSAIPLLFAGALALGGDPAPASESAPNSGAAVETLRAGIAVHPEQAVVLFQDSLQTNPDCRRELLLAALEILGDDPEYLVRLLYAARLEFPEDDVLFAETALNVVPGCAGEIRAAFTATTERMEAVLAGQTSAGPGSAGPTEETAALPSPTEARRLDEEIRDAIARVTAKAEGKAWPEQAVPHELLHFRKTDEIRIPRQSRRVDEASLYNHLPLDRHDERELAAGPVRLDDNTGTGIDFRLDESKFTRDDRRASITPAEAKARPVAPAGAVGLPRRPALPRSSVYPIPPAAGSYESTIDLESGEVAPPSLVIRPEPASPSAPRPALR